MRSAPTAAMFSRLAALVGLSLVFPLVDSFAAEPITRPLVVGHRGLTVAAPENSLAGFRACLALRVGFEFDIRRTQDGKLACLHDATLDRTTDGKGPLAERTLAEVQRLDAGAWFDPSFRGERVPTVEEILRLVGEQGSEATLIAVDLKESGDGLEAQVVQLAEKHKALDRLLFIGLAIESPEVRVRIRAASAKARVARLAADAGKIADVLADGSADWVYVRFLPSPAEVEQIHRAGKRLFFAGPLVAPLQRDNWKAASSLGFDAILTDFPLELKSQLRPQPEGALKAGP